jgi:hypothetical protein
MRTAKEAGLMAAGLVPGTGLAAAAGKFPTAEGGFEPSLMEDIKKREYLSAGLKGLGAVGDVLQAVPVVGTATGAALKAPLAAKLAMAAAPMAKVAKATEKFAKPLGYSEASLSKYAPEMKESLKTHYQDFANDFSGEMFGKPANELTPEQHAKLEQRLADDLVADARRQGYEEHDIFATKPEHISPFERRSLENAPPLSTDERLAVLHQFPSSYIDQIAEWGGLPTPSLAITKPENYLNQFGGYGDITLVGKKHLGTPAEDNPIFSTDAYTPTLPKISEGKFHSSVKGPDTPATLENLTEHMKSIPTRGGVSYSPGQYKNIANYDSPTSFYAHTAPLLKTIEDVNSRRNLISATPGMYGFKAVDDLSIMDQLLSAHADPKLKEELGSPSARAYIVDAARAGDLKKYFPTANKKDLELAQKILDERDQLYVPYFEGKPQREVKLEEFAGALAPKGTDPEVLRKLEKLGLVTHLYEDNPGELVMKHFGEHLFSRGGGVEEAHKRHDESTDAGGTNIRGRNRKPADNSYALKIARKYADGGTTEEGTVERKTWSPFRGLKITPPAEKLSSEPDIREYQLKRHAYEFEGGAEPEAPKRKVVVDAPLLGGKKELGELPYDYAGTANKVLNTLYGLKTAPLYANPYTAPVGRALDAYETVKKIEEDPTAATSYTAIPKLIRGAGPLGAVGAGAGAVMATDEEPVEKAFGGAAYGDQVNSLNAVYNPQKSPLDLSNGVHTPALNMTSSMGMNMPEDAQVQDAMRVARSALANGGQPGMRTPEQDEEQQAAVSAAYNNYLGRAPDPAGQAFWLGHLQSGAIGAPDLSQQFQQSTEGQVYAADLGRAFESAYGRAPREATEAMNWARAYREANPVTFSQANRFLPSSPLPNWNPNIPTSNIPTPPLNPQLTPPTQPNPLPPFNPNIPTSNIPTPPLNPALNPTQQPTTLPAFNPNIPTSNTPTPPLNPALTPTPSTPLPPLNPNVPVPDMRTPGMGDNIVVPGTTGPSAGTTTPGMNGSATTPDNRNEIPVWNPNIGRSDMATPPLAPPLEQLRSNQVTVNPQDYSSFVSSLYHSYTGRAPDFEGQNFFLNALNQGASPSEVARVFAASPEAQMNQVGSMYQYVLGRQPDADGLNYFKDQIAQGRMDLADVGQTLMQSPEYAGYMDRQFEAAKSGINEVNPYDFAATALKSIGERGPMPDGYRDPNVWGVSESNDVFPTSFASTLLNKGLGANQQIPTGYIDPNVMLSGKDNVVDKYQFAANALRNGLGENGVYKPYVDASINAMKVNDAIANFNPDDPSSFASGVFRSLTNREPTAEEQASLSMMSDPMAKGVLSPKEAASEIGKMVNAPLPPTRPSEIVSNSPAPSFMDRVKETLGAVLNAPGQIIKGAQQLFTGPNKTLSEGARTFLDFISKGEGGYDAMNNGTVGGKVINSTQDASRYVGKHLKDMTIREIMELQQGSPAKGRKLFAVGRYQIIPDTMRSLVKETGIDVNRKFDNETQDALGAALIARRPNLMNYLIGKSNNVVAAMMDGAKEWASLPNPLTGASFYGSGNKSGHSVADFRKTLEAARSGGTTAAAETESETQAPLPPPRPSDDVLIPAQDNFGGGSGYMPGGAGIAGGDSGFVPGGGGTSGAADISGAGGDFTGGGAGIHTPHIGNVVHHTTPVIHSPVHSAPIHHAPIHHTPVHTSHDFGVSFGPDLGSHAIHSPSFSDYAGSHGFGHSTVGHNSHFGHHGGHHGTHNWSYDMLIGQNPYGDLPSYKDGGAVKNALRIAHKRLKGGKINTRIDKDPDWDMKLARGGRSK